MKSDIREALKVLSKRDARIVSGYFGLNGKSRTTLEDIGLQFNLTRERVRQIVRFALRKLRRSTKGKALREYL